MSMRCGQIKATSIGREMGPLISGKSRLVKYYDLARGVGFDFLGFVFKELHGLLVYPWMHPIFYKGFVYLKLAWICFFWWVIFLLRLYHGDSSAFFITILGPKIFGFTFSIRIMANKQSSHDFVNCDAILILRILRILI